MPENLTRREFMRALGLTGAGLTLATVTPGVPVVEAADSKPTPVPHRFWWVKSVERPRRRAAASARTAASSWTTSSTSCKRIT